MNCNSIEILESWTFSQTNHVAPIDLSESSSADVSSRQKTPNVKQMSSPKPEPQEIINSCPLKKYFIQKKITKSNNLKWNKQNSQNTQQKTRVVVWKGG